MEPAAALREILPQEILPQPSPGIVPQAPTAKGWLTRFAIFWTDVGKIAVGLIGTALFVAVIVILYRAVDQRTIVIEAIDVPESLADTGYTSEVAAKHLRDMLRKYAEDANTRMKTPNLALHGDLPQFVVPTVGLSVDSVVASVRTFFRRENRMNISGEFVIVDSKLKLRLRKNATVIYTTRSDAPSAKPDDLYAEAAPRIFAVTEPYYNAIALSHRDLQGGLEAAQQIVADWPPSTSSAVWAHNLMGTIWHKKRKLDKAIQEYQQAIDIDTTFATPYYNLGLVLRERGQFDRAIVAFQSAIWIDPDFADAYSGLGQALKAQGRDQEADEEKARALEKHRAAVREGPDDAIAHESYGTALSGRGSLRDAIAEFRTAIGLNPDSMAAHYELGKALRDSGLLTEAIKELNTAIELDEGRHADGYRNAEAHYHLGMTMLANKEPEKAKGEFQIAIAAFGKAIERDGDDAGAYKDRGNVRLEIHDFDGAIEDYSNAIRVDPEFAAVYNDLCYLRATHERELEEAVSNCTQSLNLVPNDPDTFDSLGLAYLKLKQLDKSITAYDKALSFKPSLAESRYCRGIAKWLRGDVVGGKDDIAAAIKSRGNIANDMKRYGVEPPSE